MPRETPSPIDLPGPVRLGAGDLRWATIAIATATIFLLLTNAVSLDDWINEQRPGPAQAAAAAATDQWVRLTGEMGLGAPRAAVHARWKSAEAARFKGHAFAGND